MAEARTPPGKNGKTGKGRPHGAGPSKLAARLRARDEDDPHEQFMGRLGGRLAVKAVVAVVLLIGGALGLTASRFNANAAPREARMVEGALRGLGTADPQAVGRVVACGPAAVPGLVSIVATREHRIPALRLEAARALVGIIEAHGPLELDHALAVRDAAAAQELPELRSLCAQVWRLSEPKPGLRRPAPATTTAR